MVRLGFMLSRLTWESGTAQTSTTVQAKEVFGEGFVPVTCCGSIPPVLTNPAARWHARKS